MSRSAARVLGYACATKYQAAGLLGRQWERNAISRDRYLQSQPEWPTWTKTRDLVKRDVVTEKGGFQECCAAVCAAEGGWSVKLDGLRLLWRDTS